MQPASSDLALAPAVTLGPGEERGFYLHAPDHDDAVAFSKGDQEFRSAHLLVRPWGWTASSTPHKHVITSRYTPAGSIEYEVQGA